MALRSRLTLGVLLLLVLATGFAVPGGSGRQAAVLSTTESDGHVVVHVIPLSGQARIVATLNPGSTLLSVRGDAALVVIGPDTVARLNLKDGSMQKVVISRANAIGPLGGLSEDGRTAAIEVALDRNTINVDIVDFDSQQVHTVPLSTDKLGYTVALDEQGPLLMRDPSLFYIDAKSGKVRATVHPPSNTLGIEFSPSATWILISENISGLADHGHATPLGLPFANRLVTYSDSDVKGKTVVSMAFHDFRPMAIDDSGNVLSGDAGISNGSSLPLRLVLIRSGSDSLIALPTPKNLTTIFSGALVSDSAAVVLDADKVPPSSNEVKTFGLTISLVTTDGENRVLDHVQTTGTVSSIFVGSI